MSVIVCEVVRVVMCVCLCGGGDSYKGGGAGMGHHFLLCGV